MAYLSMCGYTVGCTVHLVTIASCHCEKREIAPLASDQGCPGYCSRKCVCVVHERSKPPVYWATISIYGNFAKCVNVHNSLRLPVLTSVLWERN